MKIFAFAFAVKLFSLGVEMIKDSIAKDFTVLVEHPVSSSRL